MKKLLIVLSLLLVPICLPTTVSAALPPGATCTPPSGYEQSRFCVSEVDGAPVWWDCRTIAGQVVCVSNDDSAGCPAGGWVHGC